MAAYRIDKQQFHAKLGALDADGLVKVLWTRCASSCSSRGRAPTWDHWTAFAARYLQALDRVAASGAGTTRRPAPRSPKDRARHLAEWHDMLLERLVGSEDEGLLDRLMAQRG